MKPKRVREKKDPSEKIPETRDLQGYMQEYHSKHKGPKNCPACALQFVCPCALHHHLNHNASCLLMRVSHISEPLQQGHPEAHSAVSFALRPEIVRMPNVLARPQESREVEEGRHVAENEKETNALKEMQE